MQRMNGSRKLASCAVRIKVQAPSTPHDTVPYWYSIQLMGPLGTPWSGKKIVCFCIATVAAARTASTSFSIYGRTRNIDSYTPQKRTRDAGSRPAGTARRMYTIAILLLCCCCLSVSCGTVLRMLSKSNGKPKSEGRQKHSYHVVLYL